MRGEALNLSSNYYYEETILPTDRLDVDVFDVKKMKERTERELVEAKKAIEMQSLEQHDNDTKVSKKDKSPIADAGSAAKQAPETAL